MPTGLTRRNFLVLMAAATAAAAVAPELLVAAEEPVRDVHIDALLTDISVIYSHPHWVHLADAHSIQIAEGALHFIGAWEYNGPPLRRGLSDLGEVGDVGVDGNGELWQFVAA